MKKPDGENDDRHQHFGPEPHRQIDGGTADLVYGFKLIVHGLLSQDIGGGYSSLGRNAPGTRCLAQ